MLGKPKQAVEGKSERWGLLRLILTFAAVAWVVRSLIFAPFSIPSGSMLPTLLIGDYVLVAKWPYGYSRFSFPFQFPPIEGRVLSNLPERGDVVVFRPPAAEGQDFVKRVIALPGDTIEVRGGAALLNGQPLQRQPLQPLAMPVSANSPCRVVPGASLAGSSGRCLYPAFRETLPGGRSYIVLDQVADGPADDFPSVRVPEGHLFLMGDNRDDSLDSRFAPVEGGIGFVPLANIVGRSTAIFWSTDGSANYFLPWTWFTALRGSRIGTSFSG
ncbi:MAG: signal peptidase I [Sphingomonas sp.]|nr:signal peptidase I [Sphingomonas sp.]